MFSCGDIKENVYAMHLQDHHSLINCILVAMTGIRNQSRQLDVIRYPFNASVGSSSEEK
jgi:hypothetical protein